MRMLIKLLVRICISIIEEKHDIPPDNINGEQQIGEFCHFYQKLLLLCIVVSLLKVT